MTTKTNGYTLYDIPCEKDVLHYGEIILNLDYVTWDRHHYRLRTIRYEDHLYEHRMVDGKVVGFRRLK